MDQFPDDWRIKQLNSLVKPDRPIAYGIVQTGDHIPGGVPCVRVVDLTEMVLDPARMIQTTRKISQQYRRTILRKDELMFVLRGEIGHVVKVPSQLIGANLTRGVALISPNDEVTSDYLAYAISSAFVKRHILHRLNGSTFKEIPLGKLRQVPVPVPPLPEQRKIAAILGAWDAAIGRVERLIAALQRRKQGLMQRLLTGAVRFPEFGGTEWEECCIGDLLTEAKRPLRLVPDKDYSLASVRRRSEGLFFREQRPGRELTSSEMYEVHTGDFLISKRQIVHGASALVTSEFDGFLVSNSYHVLSARDRMDIRYFNWLSKTPLLYHYAYVASHGVHIEKLFFILETYFQQRVVVPTSPDEQRKIASVLDNADEQIQKYRLYLAQLQAQKKGLMQRLLTGQVRVKVDSVTPAA